MVACYDAAFAPDSGAYHIILQDVSDTHTAVPYPLPPTVPQSELMVDSLAELHAFWWEHPRLNEDISSLPTEESIRGYVAHNEAQYPGMVNFLGDRLSKKRCQIF